MLLKMSVLQENTEELSVDKKIRFCYIKRKCGGDCSFCMVAVAIDGGKIAAGYAADLLFLTELCISTAGSCKERT